LRESTRRARFRRRALEADPLGNHSAVLPAILDTVRALVIGLDRQGRIVLFNRRCEELTGYSFAEVRGRRFWRLFLPASEYAGVRRVFEQLRDGRFPNRWENYWKTRDGQRRLIAWSNTAITDGAGRVVCIIGTGIDVTDERVAQAALLRARDELEQRVRARTRALVLANERLRREARQRRQAEEAWRRSEKRRRLVCAVAPVGIFEADRRGRWTYVNDYLRDLCGIAAGQEVSRQRWWRCLHRTERRELLAGLVAAQRARRVFQREVRIAAPSGGHRWVLVRTRPLPGGRGKAAGLVGTVVDITERRQAEEELRQLSSELERVTRVHEAGELTATLAHELSQPLAAIQNYARGGLRRMCANADNGCQLGEGLRHIAEQATRAGQIIEMVRRLVCKHPPTLCRLAANELVRESVRLIEPELRRAGVRLTLRLVGGDLFVAADRIQIEQVLLNLLRNAIEALAQVPSAQRQVIVRTRRWRGFAQMTVQDTGPGLPREAADRVFEPFFTTKPGGMGVGLAACRSIVQAHGGRIWTNGPAAGGAAFHFTLPRAEIP